MEERRKRIRGRGSGGVEEEDERKSKWRKWIGGRGSGGVEEEEGEREKKITSLTLHTQYIMHHDCTTEVTLAAATKSTDAMFQASAWWTPCSMAFL